MRHRKAGYKLGRTTAHRTATLRNLAASLFEHGQITTTVQKAKAVQPFIEKIVTLAKRGDIHARRLVTAKLGRDRRGFDWLYLAHDASDKERQIVENQAEMARQFFDIPDSDQVERNRYGEIRKAPKLVKHIFENVAPRYADREGGYTRIIRLGMHRIGDAAEICVLQFVGAEDGPEIGGNPSQRRRTADKRTAYAERLAEAWGGTATAEEAPPAEPEVTEEAAAADEPAAEATEDGSEEKKDD
ncbi:MAG: 50S ribosomal protein L17 [Planctomycetota bacterium]